MSRGSVTSQLSFGRYCGRMIAAASKLPALLIVNPTAGRLTDSARAEVTEALASAFDLEVFSTTAREVAIEMARDAAANSTPLVIAFGGDGHVNEVANGVAGSSSSLGIIPGGTMNVFARSLDIPLDALSAVERLKYRCATEPRKVSLGMANDRYFTFSAGCGFDAEAAELVERDITAKRRFGEIFFYWSAFRVLTGSYRHRKPSMILRGPFGDVPVAMAVACNTGPYAYLGGRAIELTPDVELDRGLDIFALRTMRIEAFPMYAWRCLVSGDLVHHKDSFYASDLGEFELSADEPFHRHVDGEPLPLASEVRFRMAPEVLRVMA